MALTTEEFEGQSVKSLKTLVAKQVGVPRFRQRWLSKDHTELPEDAFVSASDVQLLVLDFVEAEAGEVQKLFDACEYNDLDQVDELLRKPLNPNVVDEEGNTALHSDLAMRNPCCLKLETDPINKDGFRAFNSAAHRHLAAWGWSFHKGWSCGGWSPLHWAVAKRKWCGCCLRLVLSKT